MPAGRPTRCWPAATRTTTSRRRPCSRMRALGPRRPLSCLDVAHRDLARGALRTAAELLDRAEAAGATPAELAGERVLHLLATGRAAEALGVGGPALDRATGDRHAELALRLARAAVPRVAGTTRAAYVERAGRPDDPRSPALLADAAHGAGRIEEAAAYAAEAVALAERTGTPADLCQALVAQARVARLHDLAASGAGFGRAAQLAAEHGLAAWRVEALHGLGSLEALESESIATLEAARAVGGGRGSARPGHRAGHDDRRAPAARRRPAGRRDLAEDARRARGRAAAAGGRAGRPSTSWPLPPPSPAARDELETRLGRWTTAYAGPEVTSPARVRAGFRGPRRPRPEQGQRDSGRGDEVRWCEHRSAAPLHHFGLWALLRTVADDRGAEARETLRARRQRLAAGQPGRPGLRRRGGGRPRRAGREAAALSPRPRTR